MDYEVFLGLNFGRFNPRIIVSEEYSQNTMKHTRKHALLRDVGYTFWVKVGCDEIWVGKGVL